ncbi:hypothetical protein [Maribacter sp. ACAM166]|uniref:hypothetical protein n=1 Tax=Maribacter sp. ACAM166 TaxID=2508996 RepID=UPI0010FD06CD|nr:hypothetical protein [Maribacter sp. ACAM166]TLP71855.1 hypothetical protein ES765_19220 [Maribacter sp. ACAM166]
MKIVLCIPLLLFCLLAQAQIPVMLPDNIGVNDTEVKIIENKLELIWPIENLEQCQLVLNLEKDKPLFRTIAIGRKGNFKTISTNVEPVFLLNVGSRTLTPENGWTIFFDKVPTRSYTSHLLDLNITAMKITKHKNRTVIIISDISAPDFKGSLEITIYNGIPLFNIAAVIETAKDSTAILYDAGLTSETPWKTVEFSDTSDDLQQINTSESDNAVNVSVNYRSILATNNQGSLAVFPPPHQYFYPLDEAYNLKSVWYGKGYRDIVQDFGVGIRHDPKGDERYVPWFNAPPNTAQRLNFFCMLSSGLPDRLLEKIKKYTHKDKYVPLKNYKTFASHFHNEFIMNVVLADKPIPQKPEFVDVFKSMGVDIVHLGEFHYTAHPKGPDEVRLKELKALFDECKRLSDKEFLLLPGEEPNEFLGGHWMCFFPNPVYWIMSRDADKPFVSEDPTYGKVYRIADKNEMLQLLELEKGLAWTAHPRIKGSTGYPDIYKEETFFKSDRFMGGAWKSMPADLSISKLALRVFDLMDDMNNWGTKKKVIAEADLFTITEENEMYAHMNINYLELDAIPNFSEGWQPVFNALENGRFFSTTGEILIPSFSINGKGSGETVQLNKFSQVEVKIEIDWTFPLNFVEIISGDGENVFREKIDLNETKAFGSQKFQFSAKMANRKWVRLEVWDVAVNGAFTQTVYLE